MTVFSKLKLAFNFKTLLYNGFAILGASWTVIEVCSFFLDGAKDWFLGYRVLLLIVASLATVCWTLWSEWPQTAHSYRLNNRDVEIEISVTDAFDAGGALVVPMNTSYDTDLCGRLIFTSSIQSKLLSGTFGGDVAKFDKAIEGSIAKSMVQFTAVPEKTVGKKQRCQHGEVITISVERKTFYLLALTDVKNDGTIECSDEMLRTSLSKLWYYLSEKGTKTQITIPLLGTGHGRLTLRREDVARLIVRSFIASCAQKTYCDKLVIAISPSDFAKHRVDFNQLARFLEYSCCFTEFAKADVIRIGEPLLIGQQKPIS